MACNPDAGEYLIVVSFAAGIRDSDASVFYRGATLASELPSELSGRYGWSGLPIFTI
jgi:hypothetical protein